MESLVEEWPSLLWALDRTLPPLLLCCAAAQLRRCWKQAQANQKLALGDAFDYRDSERRGLLLPVSTSDRRF